MKIITFLTDFGVKDGYVAQMKGVVCGISDARLVDITHEVSPHHVREAAFILRSTAPSFPSGTVHVVVVDPGVGTGRRGLVVTTNSHILIGPDNGVLMPTAHQLGEFIVYEITNSAYQHSSVSSTFHGRDVFAPVAAYITKGIRFAEIGRRITDFVDLEFKSAENKGNVITGKILYVDRFGNLITNIPAQILPKNLEYHKTITMVFGKDRKELPFVQSYGFVKKGEGLVTVGSSQYLEIGVNQGNASQVFSLKEDDDILVLPV